MLVSSLLGNTPFKKKEIKYNRKIILKLAQFFKCYL